MQFVGDLGHGCPGRQLAEDLEFPLRKLAVQRTIGIAAHAVRQNLRECGAHEFPPMDDRADGADQLCRGRLLVEIAGGTGAQQVHGVLILGIPRQHEHGQFGPHVLQCLERINAVLVGHGDVEEHDVEFRFANERNGLVAGGSFARDLHVGLVRDELSQSRANDSVVICDQYTNHGRW